MEKKEESRQSQRERTHGWRRKWSKCSNGHQSILHCVGDPHSQISDSKLYSHAASYRAHAVEPESPLPHTEQGAPQWTSLKAEAQETLGLTRDNIYPETIMSCFEDCMHFDRILETLEALHLYPLSSIELVIMTPGLYRTYSTTSRAKWLCIKRLLWMRSSLLATRSTTLWKHLYHNILWENNTDNAIKVISAWANYLN